MYYGILSIAVVLFSLQFLFNQRYEAIAGHTLRAAAKFMCLSGCAGVLILLCVNRFRVEFTPFTLLIAGLSASLYILYNVCSIRALGKINLSLFSLFTTLGGMLLPFAAGILFYKEPLTMGKLLCFVLVLVAILLGVNGNVDKQGLPYYIGVFVSNGMIGVLAKIFSAAPYAKVSSAAFSMTVAFLMAAASGVFLLVTKDPQSVREPRQKRKAAGYAAGYGVLNYVGNFLMLLSLTHVAASAQYPMTTGGMIIVSTILCVFTPNKPKKKEILAVVISFVGILLLVLV